MDCLLSLAICVILFLSVNVGTLMLHFYFDFIIVLSGWATRGPFVLTILSLCGCFSGI